ncbi:SDR family NAD(P)-dependent oxidoreductase [Mycobacterium sp.]|uniref:SDR family NAD(P)-dependent oxidoreductase n=1 Tax=Mycobacterium sp. TaxID=1785 RepID=UPI0012084CBA|nr:SDR family NAD(P)-dependent oxidoreductase [Mycobacterium sp.]TAM65161.1 MAG: SDR family oxidoreductase [Mycobacterium sp.]
MRLKDKVIAITGSGSGLGRESALLFSSEGATVVTSDVVPGRAKAVAEQILAEGGNATSTDADVRSESDMERLVAETVEAHGRIDVMWANAGIPEPGFGMSGFVDSALADWDNIFAVNVTGIYLAWRAAAKWMVTNGETGNLLATSSAASFNAYPGFPMYTASKAAANGLTRAAALELGKFGIRANALCPVHGMSVNFAMGPEADVLGKSYEEMTPWDPDKRAMPLRLEQPPVIRDNAYLALFLVSDESRYMSGQTIASADGGNFARTSIIFPTDLGGDDITEGVLPEDIRNEIDR